jgi:hypothetical protein
MIHQLIWIEAILKGGVGLALLLFPRSFARLAGLPPSESGFWPRLVGGLLLAIAAALLAEPLLEGRGRGLGFAGAVIVNLVGVLTLLTVLVLGEAGATRRGRALVVAALIVLSLLTLTEVAWV